MIGGLQGEFGDLDIKYLKQKISKCRSHISGSFRRTPRHCEKWREIFAAKGQHFRSQRLISQPCNILPSAWSDLLAMTVINFVDYSLNQGTPAGHESAETPIGNHTNQPARPEDFRAWTHPSQSDIVHTLSRGASSRHYILRKELPPNMFIIDALLCHNIFPLQHWVQRRGVLLEALFRIYEGYFFGPHHLIMAALLYFDKKILEHLGYPAKPQHERRRICREIFTLDKWTSMTAYGGADQGAPARPEHPEEPEEPVDIPANTQPPAPAVASTEPIPERPIPHFPGIGHFSEHPHSADDSSSCSSGADYYHSGPAHCHLEANSASSGYISPEPSQAPHFVDQTMPPKEPTIGEAEAVEPPSPQHPPATSCSF
uniref:Uncharacterized protein n=1 Tax=Vitis vinifera TaxID=29760 RepID=A5B342_VITVI|nr:hypothetical protein VITISV_032186 [Vitis vinifera]